MWVKVHFETIGFFLGTKCAHETLLNKGSVEHWNCDPFWGSNITVG